MSRQSTNLETNKDLIAQQLLSVVTGIIGSLLAAAIIAIGAYFISQWFALPPWIKSWWFDLILVIICFVVLMFFNRKNIITRILCLQIYKEVSASRCNDIFIKLAIHYFHYISSKNEVLIELQKVAEYRKHPNERILSSLKIILQSHDTLLLPIKEKVLLYLKVLSERDTLRQKVIQNVVKFLREDYLTSDTYFVLYGYSPVVCQSLVSLREELVTDGKIDRKYKYLPCPVFLIQDLQYGRDGSLNEHEKAKKHLKKGFVTSFILPFDQLALLFSANADFVHDEFGRLIPLSRKRRIIGLIGCEVSDTRGNIWIPAQLKGIPSETGKFVEVFSQNKSEAGNSLFESLLVVTSESYKIYRYMSEEDSITFAPIKTSMLKDFLYLLGIFRRHPSIKIELIKLDPSQFHTIIDDYGEHKSNGKNINLWLSLDEWEKLTIRKIFPEVHRVDLRTMLQSQTFIFDFSGVIAADVSERFSAFQSVVAEELKGTLSYNEYMRTYFGLSDSEAIRRLIEDKAPSGDFDAALVSKRKKYYAQLSNEETPAIPEAVELIRDLHRDGKKCFLVTSSSQAEVEKFIIQHKLHEVFPSNLQHYLANAIDLRKKYMDIIKASDDDPTKCVLVDNALWHLTLARELGIGTISFATNRAISRAEVDALVRDARELRDEYIELTVPSIEKGGVLHE